MGSAAAPPQPPAPASDDRHCYTWRDDPDRYIRPVKGGKYQARPHDTLSGERENLGLFATRAQARTAIREFWAGKLRPRPKFVRSSRSPAGPRFFVVLPAPTAEGGRRWQRVGGWYATADAAAAARDGFLRAAFGPLAAAAMLSRRDTSAYGKRGLVAIPVEVRPRPNRGR